MLSSCKHRCGVYPPWLQITVSPLVFHIFLGEVHRSRPRLGFAVKVAVFCPGIFRSYPHFRRHETDRSGGRKGDPWDFHLGFPLEITNSWLVSWKIPSENAENAWFRGTPISRNLRDLSTNGFVTQVIFTTGMILQVFWLWQKLCAGLWKWDNTWWLMMVNDG